MKLIVLIEVWLTLVSLQGAEKKETQNIIPVIYSRLMREFFELNWTKFDHKASENSFLILPKVCLNMLWNTGWKIWLVSLKNEQMTSLRTNELF